MVSRWLAVAATVAVLAVLSFGVGFLLAGDVGTTPTTPTTSATTPALPPDLVAGAWDEPVTVTGSLGDRSVTVEVTLTAPAVSTEVDLGGGRVGRPARGAYFATQAIIEVVDGVYEFNTLHFHLVPSAGVGQWRQADGGPGPEPVPGFEPNLKTTRLSTGDRISGSLVFDVPESALAGAAIVLRSWLQPDGPAAAYWPLD